MTNKYHAKKCTSTDGIAFDSKKERDRWEALRIMEKQGLISNLRRQIPYILIPNQRDEKTGKVIERAIKYIADFAYDDENGEQVEDVKGYRDPSSAGYAKFVIKRKLMLYKYGIRVKEV